VAAFPSHIARHRIIDIFLDTVQQRLLDYFGSGDFKHLTRESRFFIAAFFSSKLCSKKLLDNHIAVTGLIHIQMLLKNNLRPGSRAKFRAWKSPLKKISTH
jgi:hypothetical protein